MSVQNDHHETTHLEVDPALIKWMAFLTGIVGVATFVSICVLLFCVYLFTLNESARESLVIRQDSTVQGLIEAMAKLGERVYILEQQQKEHALLPAHGQANIFLGSLSRRLQILENSTSTDPGVRWRQELDAESAGAVEHE